MMELLALYGPTTLVGCIIAGLIWSNWQSCRQIHHLLNEQQDHRMGALATSEALEERVAERDAARVLYADLRTEYDRLRADGCKPGVAPKNPTIKDAPVLQYTGKRKLYRSRGNANRQARIAQDKIGTADAGTGSGAPSSLGQLHDDVPASTAGIVEQP